MPNPSDRFLNPVTGGGALLDMGCYLIQFATLGLAVSVARTSSGLRMPDSIASAGVVSRDGVDLENSYVLQVGADEVKMRCRGD